MRACPLILALAVSPVPSALADGQPRAPFRVEFSEGLNCGKPEDFSAELLRRSQHVRPARSGEDGFAFRVDICASRGIARGPAYPAGGRRAGDGSQRPRCHVRRGHPGAGRHRRRCSSSPAPRSSDREPPRSTALRPAPSGDWGFGASVGPVIAGGRGTKGQVGDYLEANTAFESGVLSPLFALAYTRTLTGEAPTQNGTAELRWWTVRASLCLLRWPESGKLALRPCGLFDIGRLDAVGTQTDVRAFGHDDLGSAGGQRQARRDAGRRVLADRRSRAGRATEWDRFLFDPGPLVAFRPPELGGLGRLAVGGRFRVIDSRDARQRGEKGTGFRKRPPNPVQHGVFRTGRRAGRGPAAAPLESSSRIGWRSSCAAQFRGVWRLVRRFGVPSASADDAAQEVFIIAARRLDEIKIGHERRYLFGIAIRVAANARRARARRLDQATAMRLPSLRASSLSDALLDQKRMRELSDSVLDAMPLELRTAFVLFELEGFSVPEIAELLAIPTGTAASRLRRAREFQETVTQLKKAPRARRGTP